MKHLTLLVLLLFGLSSISFAQIGQPLPEIMEEKFPDDVASNTFNQYKFVETNGQRQLVEIATASSTLYCITDGTKANSSFYGEVTDAYGYYAEGAEFSFLRPNPNDEDIIELLKYDAGQDELAVTNSFDFDLSFNDYVEVISPNLFGIFGKDGFDHELTVFEPSGSGFTELQNLIVPDKVSWLHHFISDESYIYFDIDSGELVFSKHDFSNSTTTELGVVAQTTSSVFEKDLQSNDLYVVFLLNITSEDVYRPVVFNKQTEAITVLDDIDEYSFGNDLEFEMFLTGEKLFLFKANGEIDYHNLSTNVKKTIPVPSRGAIDYDGRIGEYLVKGDQVFLRKSAPSLGWHEYFYYNEAANELEILVDDYYEDNGYASRGSGMFVYDNKIILGFSSGFNSCGIMFLEEDLVNHNLYTFPDDDFCLGDIWINDEKIIIRNNGGVRVMEQDNDEDMFILWDECDDFDSAINPNATEIPNNNIDEDCDGLDLMTSLDDLEKLKMNIFPNPTSDLIYLDFGTPLQGASIEILNALGERVWANKYNNVTTLDIDLSNFVSGIYIVAVQSGNKVGEIRVAKK